ncbi:MAG: hypothetical protein AAGK22_05525 [Acidobacteriota bacterium]
MLRSFLAAFAGYATVVVLSVASAGICWLVFGAEGAFHPGSTVASNGWSLLSCVLGFVSAVIAGVVTAALGRHSRNAPVTYLAVMLLVFGLSLAILGRDQEPRDALPEGKSTAELSFVEAGQVSSTPTWYDFVIGFVGAAGVLLGGALRGPGKPLPPRRV